ncbi:hypothetical protein CRG98_042214, partial [Punica granatum]
VVRAYFLEPQVRRATSLLPLATLPGLLIRASLLSYTASSPSDLARASCNLAGSASPSEFTILHRNSPSHLPRASSNLAGSANPSPSDLARASCNLVGSANPCEVTFLRRKFDEPPPSCLLEPCRVRESVRVYFLAPQVRRATSLVPLATLSGLLTRARLLSCAASSTSHLPRASWNLAGSANPCEFTFLHRKFAEPPRSCLLQPCRVTFLRRKFDEPPPSCLLEPCRVRESVRVYFLAPQVRRATSLVPLATLSGLLTRARLLSCAASSTSHLPRASWNLAGSANPCEFTFLHRKFAEPPRSCLLQPCRVTFLRRKFDEPPPSCLLEPCRVRESVRVYFLAPQVRRATSLVPLATLSGLLTRARLLSCAASSTSHLPRASWNLAGSANPCEFTFLHRKFAEPPRSCLLQPCRCQLSRERLFSCTTSSPTYLAHASGNLAGYANPCKLTFLRRKFAEPTPSCLLQPCWCQLSRERLFSCTTSSPTYLAHASGNLAGSANPCEFTFVHRKFIELPRSCLSQPCSVSYPVRDYFPAPQVHRPTSLMPLATLPGLLTRASLLSSTASSPSHLARAPFNLAGSVKSCELTFLNRKFAEPPRSCPLQPCRVC